MDRNSRPLSEVIETGLLKTPTAQLAVNGGSQHPDKRRAGGHGPTLADQVEHQLLPTPEASDATGGRVSAELGGQRPSGSKRAITIATAVAHLLPTPMTINRTSQRAQTGRPTSGPQRGEPSYGLEDVLLPTPQAHDTAGAKTPEQVAAMRARGFGVSNLNEVVAHKLLPTPETGQSPNGHGIRGGKKGNGHQSGESLDNVVTSLLPTPTARLGDDTGRGADPARYKGPQSRNGRRSNLDDCITAVEAGSPWLLPTPAIPGSRESQDPLPGFSAGDLMGLPSSDGKPLSGAAHPGQLSPGEQESA